MQPAARDEADSNYESWDLGHPWSVRLRRPRQVSPFVFPCQFAPRSRVRDTRYAIGGTRRRNKLERTRSTKRKRMQEEKGDRAGHTWQCTTKAWWMRGRLVYVIETWSPADGVVRLSVTFLFLSHWNGLSSVFRPFHVAHVTHENSNHPCHRSDRSYCHILRTQEKLLS